MANVAERDREKADLQKRRAEENKRVLPTAEDLHEQAEKIQHPCHSHRTTFDHDSRKQLENEYKNHVIDEKRKDQQRTLREEYKQSVVRSL